MDKPRAGADGSRPAMLAAMSAADGWDLTVPDDDAELMAELRRHGVRPGHRLHVALAAQELEDAGVAEPPAFFGSFSGPADLAERADDILRAEFPHGL